MSGVSSATATMRPSFALIVIILMCAIGSSNADSRRLKRGDFAVSQSRARHEVPLSSRVSIRERDSSASTRHSRDTPPLSRRTSRLLFRGKLGRDNSNSLVTDRVLNRQNPKRTVSRTNKSDRLLSSSLKEPDDQNQSESTKKTVASDVLDEEFPFLDGNFDYNNYYYDYEFLPIAARTADKASKVAITTESPTAGHINTPVKDVVVRRKTRRNLTPRDRERNIFSFRVAGSRKISHFSAKQVVTTTQQSLLKVDDRNKDTVRLRGTLKDVRMFRHFSKIKKTSPISLHERLQSHLKGSVKSTTTLPITAMFVDDPIRRVRTTQQEATSTAPTTIPTTKIPTTTIVLPTSITVPPTTAKKQLTTEVTLFTPTTEESKRKVSDFASIPKYTPTTLPLKIAPKNLISLIDNFGSLREKKLPPVASSVKPAEIYPAETTDEDIKTNVTFSTSKTQNTGDTYPDVISLSLLESQLGVAPSGITPFGESPFGEEPFGEKPFGEKPEGLAPLGHHSLAALINQTSSPQGGQEGTEGRYHVQVTAPNGSINGDYIVVDPATGDLNGVRYEVAKDVDPLLVQKALLNFLSLDPSMSPHHANVEVEDVGTLPENLPEDQVTTQVPLEDSPQPTVAPT